MFKRLLRRAIVVLAIAAGLGTAVALPANASAVPGFQVYYTMVNAYSNQCMEVNNTSGTSVNTTIQQNPCSGDNNQLWLWKNWYDSGDHHFRNNYTGLCISSSYGVVQATCGAAGSTFTQWWYQVGVGGGLWEIRNIYYDHCLEVPGASTVNGARIVSSPCNGSANQRWRMV